MSVLFIGAIMRTRIVKHKTETKTWYTAQQRKFFIWFNIPGVVECMTYELTFSTVEEAEAHIYWYFRKDFENTTIVKEIKLS